MTKRLERRIAASLERSRVLVVLALRRITDDARRGRTSAAAVEVLMEASVVRGRLLQIAEDYAALTAPAKYPRTDKKASAPCPPNK